MKRNSIRRAGSILVSGAAMLAVLTACGGSTGGTAPVPPAPALQPAVPVPTAPVPPASIPAGGAPPSDPLAKGKLIFEKTAGGAGCAYCHGLDGKGGGTSGLGAPDIRDTTEARVRGALIGGVPSMSFIKLSDEEIIAVAAYLQSLNH